MATIMYVIVPASEAAKLNLIGVRDKLNNGCYLLRDKDLTAIEGATLFERVSRVRGAIVNEGEAILIKNGKLPVPIENETPQSNMDPDNELPENTPEQVVSEEESNKKEEEENK